jgi:hypothetical protein
MYSTPALWTDRVNSGTYGVPDSRREARDIRGPDGPSAPQAGLGARHGLVSPAAGCTVGGLGERLARTPRQDNSAAMNR